MRFQFQNKKGGHRLAFAFALELHEDTGAFTGYASISGNL